MKKVNTVEEIKIEKNVPLPSLRRKIGKYVELFKKMTVGDSFAVDNISDAVSVRQSAAQYKLRKTDKKPFRLTSRTEENGSVRFWRIE